MITNNGFKIAINRIGTDTPDYDVVSQFKIGKDQVSVSATDTDLTTPVEISGGAYFKDLSEAPYVDEANYEITTTSYLNSVEANGEDLNAIGVFNKDSTPLMQDIFMFTPITKSDSVGIVIEIKNRLVRR